MTLSQSQPGVQSGQQDSHLAELIHECLELEAGNAKAVGQESADLICDFGICLKGERSEDVSDLSSTSMQT